MFVGLSEIHCICVFVFVYYDVRHLQTSFLTVATLPDHLATLLDHLATLLGHMTTLLDHLVTLLDHLATLLDHLLHYSAIKVHWWIGPLS